MRSRPELRRSQCLLVRRRDLLTGQTSNQQIRRRLDFLSSMGQSVERIGE